MDMNFVTLLIYGILSTRTKDFIASFTFLMIIALTGVNGAFISNPRNTTAFVGDTVVMECSVSNGTVFSGWQRLPSISGSSVAINTNQSTDKHYTTNTTTPGQHDLLIKGAQPADAGRYLCQAGFDNSHAGRLALVDPMFTTNASDAISLKDTVVLSCRLFIYGSDKLNCSITVFDQSEQVVKMQNTSAVFNNTILQAAVTVNSVDSFGPYYCTVACQESVVLKILIVKNITQVYMLSSSIPAVNSATAATCNVNIHGPGIGIGIAIGIGISIIVALVVVAFIYIGIRQRSKDTTTKQLYESAMSPTTAAVNDGLYTDLQQIGANS